ncbi:ABC transporter permease [Ferrovibrio sp. MS7]|uniref:ABC transporter permease n=1 Tax=Ferrovibrio plantarum TaxID=3119164 RepID=UPI00313507B4
MSRLGWIRLLLIAGLVGLLELACRLAWIKKATMIPPSEMAQNLWRLLRIGKLNNDIAATLGNVGIAFLLCVSVGFALGVVIHSLPRLRRVLDPLLATWYAVPFFVFYPIFIVIFGLNRLPIIVIGFLFGVVAMIVSTLNGLDRIPPVLLKTARLHHMPPLSVALRIKLPSALPHLFTGVKLSVAYSFIGVIASEFILSGGGLGYSIAYAYNNFDNRTMYALMLFILLLVGSINAVLHVWEQRLIARRGGR